VRIDPPGTNLCRRIHLFAGQPGRNGRPAAWMRAAPPHAWRDGGHARPAVAPGPFPAAMLLSVPYQEPAAISEKTILSAEDEAELDATIQKIADCHGHVSNLMQTLALAPRGLDAFATLTGYTRYDSQLTELQRQLAILIAVRDVHYAWTHHTPLARAAGVTNAQILLLQDGRVPMDLPPPERALCDYVFEIAAGRRVPQRVAEAVHGNFSPRQIVDIALLTSCAMAAAALAVALEVPVEAPDILQFELEWQRRKTGI
jgi:4-carboxymuconolactone decarboxylase